MLELLILSLISMKIHPERIYTVLLHLKHSINSSIPFSLSDTSWNMHVNGTIAYTIFHTYSLDDEILATIGIVDSLLHLGFLMEADTVFTIPMGTRLSYPGKAFELAGLLLIPHPAFKLDSIRIITHFEWAKRTIKLHGEGKWEGKEILPFVFLSGYTNEIHTFGEGVTKILMGKVTILK